MFLIQSVEAQPAVDTTWTPPTSNFDTLGSIFAFAINIIIGVGWALVFVMLALGFVQYIMSKGEKTAVDAAQKWLTYAVIGGIGLFLLGFLRTVIPGMIGSSEGDLTGALGTF